MCDKVSSNIEDLNINEAPSQKKMPKKLSNQVSLIGEKVEIDQQTISQTIKES